MELISGEQLAQRRKLLGYSQIQLATKADVSLPTLQNIEAGRANPTWDILSKLFDILRYSVRIEEEPLDWEVLSYVGLPLAYSLSRQSQTRVTPMAVKAELRKALAYLASASKFNREEEALIAFAAALHDHYPRLFQKYASKHLNDLLKTKIKQMDQGRFIRLRRTALGSLRKEFFE